MTQKKPKPINKSVNTEIVKPNQFMSIPIDNPLKSLIPRIGVKILYYTTPNRILLEWIECSCGKIFHYPDMTGVVRIRWSMSYFNTRLLAVKLQSIPQQCDTKDSERYR